MDKVKISHNSLLLRLALWGLGYNWKKIPQYIEKPNLRKQKHQKLMTCDVNLGLLCVIFRLLGRVILVSFLSILVFCYEIICGLFGWYIQINSASWKEIKSFSTDGFLNYIEPIPFLNNHVVAMRPIYLLFIGDLYCNFTYRESWYIVLILICCAIWVISFIVNTIDYLHDLRKRRDNPSSRINTPADHWDDRVETVIGLLVELYESVKKHYCKEVEVV